MRHWIEIVRLTKFLFLFFSCFYNFRYEDALRSVAVVLLDPNAEIVYEKYVFDMDIVTQTK